MRLKFKKKSAYVIAEIGNNHEGSISRAKKMIKLASKTGVDAVKFQTFKTSGFISNKAKEKSIILNKFQLSQANFKELKSYAHKHKLNFISTPLDLDSAYFLGKISDAIKISSGDNNYFKMIEIALSFNKNVIISTGLLNFKEANKLIKKVTNKFRNKKKLIFLHCVSSYPVKYKNANLKRISKFKERWKNIKFGYSDHTLGIEACLASRILGADVIEKHFTINKNFSNFRDHSLSADFTDMKHLVLSLKRIEQMIFKFSENLSMDEKKNAKIFRRQPYAFKDLKTNEVLNEKNIRFLRPHLPVNFTDPQFFLGKKLKKKISKNQLIKKSDIK